MNRWASRNPENPQGVPSLPSEPDNTLPRHAHAPQETCDECQGGGLREIVFRERGHDFEDRQTAVGEWGDNNPQGHRTFLPVDSDPLYLFVDEVLHDDPASDEAKAGAAELVANRKAYDRSKRLQEHAEEMVRVLGDVLRWSHLLPLDTAARARLVLIKIEGDMTDPMEWRGKNEILAHYRECAEELQRLRIVADKLLIALAANHQPHTLIFDRPCSDCDLIPGRRKGTNTEPSAARALSKIDNPEGK